MPLQIMQPKMQTSDVKKTWHVCIHMINQSEIVICSYFATFETYYFIL